MVGSSFDAALVGIAEAVVQASGWADTTVVSGSPRDLVFAVLYGALLMVIVQQYRHARRRGWDRF